LRTGKKSTRPLDKHRSIERSHRIDNEEFYQLLRGVVIDDAKVFNEKIKEWEHYYNYDRPHGGLGGQTPYERLMQKQLQSDPSVTRLRQTHMQVGPWI
jgi:transposase InsO family protein